MSALTLPGSIPGLLRRGSPVWCDVERGVILDVYELCGETRVTFAWFDLRPMGCALSHIALDLTDATGRAHAAWWLAGQSPDRFDPLQATWHGIRGCADEGREAAWLCSGAWWTASRPPLADLDPNDTRLLPDSSRWVDAEALRRVVLHVAGVAS